MASGSQDSRGKHRRSISDDESLERSKRHKHRHRHRHRHRRHRDHKDRSRSNKDNGRETEAITEGGEDGQVQEMFQESAPLAKSKTVDYDMEEGEILEDDELPDFGGKKGEPAHSLAVGAPSAMGTSDMIIENSEGNLKNKVIGKEHACDDESSSQGHSVNKGVDHRQSDKADKSDVKSRRISSARSKVKTVQNGINGFEGNGEALDLMEVDEGGSVDQITSLSHLCGVDGYKKEFSPASHETYDNEINFRRSKSPYHETRKSHTRPFLDEEYSRRSRDHYIVVNDNGKSNHVLDDDMTGSPNINHQYDDTDSVKDKERERSSSDRRRHSRSDAKHHKGASYNREEEKTFRDTGHGKERDIRDEDHVVERKQERIHGREREKGREHDRKWEKVKESRDGIYDREYDERWDREKEHRRDLERERRRDSSRSKYRDRDVDRDVENERERRLERAIDGDERRDSRSDRHKDKVRGAGSDRNYRYSRYDDDWHGDRGRSYESRHVVRDEERSYRDRHRKHITEKNQIVDEDSLKGSEVKANRDEDAQDDISESMELEILDQEEEDINRIKEESRRRREAILLKYRTQQQQQQQDESQLKDAGKESVPLKPLDKVDDQEIDVSDQDFSVGKSPVENEAYEVNINSGAGGLGEGTPKSERSNDMFRDDIFGDSPAGGHKMCKGDSVLVERSSLRDNWDDPEGYYSYRLGELLDGRYEIAAAHGKGVFSTVVRAKDLKAGSGDPEEVAIKIIRNNDTMLKAGMEELTILKKLVAADPDDRRHCVRYLSSFKYRNHLCLVFESLHMNLREVLKKFGRNIGLKLTAVRAYSKQLFIALKHLRNCGVLHCDIKPDNMLVNDAKNVLKLCDFGNAMFAGKNEVTPYLVSRFYRAPEIILGLQYDHPLDIWSVGCCLYELYTGKVLFPGATNSDMLRLHMELKGPFSKKMLRKGAFTDQNFDPDLNFLATEEDPVTKKIIRRLMVNIKPRDIGMLIKGSPGEEPKMLTSFKDLLDKIFVLDPDKRLTVSQALNHPFITGK